jgi:hypothetical protein
MLRKLLNPGRQTAGAAVALAIRLVSAVIAFLSQILLARWLGAGNFGVVTALLVWVNVLGTVSTLGFATSVLRFLPHYLARSALPLARGFHRTGIVVALLAGAAIAGLGLLVLGGAATLLPAPYAEPARMALLALPAFALADFLDGVGRSRGWVVLALIPPYIIRPVMILLGVAAIEASGAALDAASATLAAVVAIWISALAQLALQARPLATAMPAGPRAYDLNLWSRVSLPMLLLDGVALLLLNIDIILLGFFVGPDDIARYFASQRIISLVSFIHFERRRWVPFCDEPRAGQASRSETEFGRSRLLPSSLVFSQSCSSCSANRCSGFGSDFVSAWPVAILAIGLLARAAGPAQTLVATGHHNATVSSCAPPFWSILSGIVIPRHG